MQTKRTVSGRSCNSDSSEASDGRPAAILAPQSGHVSNFCQPVGPVIEPMDAYCFQNDQGQRRCSFGLGTQSGHVSNWPFWTRSPGVASIRLWQSRGHGRMFSPFRSHGNRASSVAIAATVLSRARALGRAREGGGIRARRARWCDRKSCRRALPGTSKSFETNTYDKTRCSVKSCDEYQGDAGDDEARALDREDQRSWSNCRDRP